ncbi:hypothetical protein E3U43_010196 [Larimichthys crocea]|uniref:Uncharacterized protein n=1 Tax=Larimichthys crocea TaxID=215358 RepID=A0ACD3RET5_LARCR|nr:hypothetical protein E3U43_010196 [Larimichthys crocea]
MEEKTDIPNELFESVREAVGRRVKLTLRRKVQLEVKGDKVENRVLAKKKSKRLHWCGRAATGTGEKIQCEPGSHRQNRMCRCEADCKTCRVTTAAEITELGITTLKELSAADRTSVFTLLSLFSLV